MVGDVPYDHLIRLRPGALSDWLIRDGFFSTVSRYQSIGTEKKNESGRVMLSQWSNVSHPQHGYW